MVGGLEVAGGLEMAGRLEGTDRSNVQFPILSTLLGSPTLLILLAKLCFPYWGKGVDISPLLDSHVIIFFLREGKGFTCLLQGLYKAA